MGSEIITRAASKDKKEKKYINLDFQNGTLEGISG